MIKADGQVGHLVERVAEMLRHAAPPDMRDDDAWREASDIITALLDEPRHWTAVHKRAPVSPDLERAAIAAAERRAGGMPLCYAVGRAPFRHLTLHVDERVLIPRPETEGLVDLVLERVEAGGIAVDVGTGSGAIALALASEGRFERVIGTDVSTDALAVARANGDRLGPTVVTPVEWRSGAFLAPVRGVRARAVVSNPPYISLSEITDVAAGVRAWEPTVALFSGAEGMDATATIVREAADALEPGGLLALEVDARRAAQVAALASADGRYGEVVVHVDLAGRERYITAVRTSGS